MNMFFFLFSLSSYQYQTQKQIKLNLKFIQVESNYVKISMGKIIYLEFTEKSRSGYQNDQYTKQEINSKI